MADNVEITINNKTVFAGRLIGVIDAQELRAILNVEDAARKVYSAESVTLDDVQPLTHKRFVVATSNYSSDHRREIFISPIVQYISYLHTKKIFHCADNNEYNIKDI